MAWLRAIVGLSVLGLAGATLAVLAPSCSSPKPDRVFHDLTFSVDGTGTGDAAPMGDMEERAWTDHSYSTQTNLFSVWSNGNGLVLAAGDSALVLKTTNGGVFAPEASNGVSGFDSSQIFYGMNAVQPGPPSTTLYMVGGNDTAGSGTIWSYAGNLAAGSGQWTPEKTTTTALYGVWVDTTGTGFAVGTNTALRRSGTTWSALSGIGTNRVFGLWAENTGSAYAAVAVGHDEPPPDMGAGNGLAWNYNGGSFVQVAPGNVNALYSVWAASPTDIYAVGDMGTILHSTNGTDWTPQTSGVTDAVEGISGVSADEIYAVHDSGIIHKFSAGSTVWEPDTLPATVAGNYFLGVYATATEVWAVGESGSIVKK